VIRNEVENDRFDASTLASVAPERAFLGIKISSVITWDRTELRRDTIGQINKDLVDVTPSPTFRRIVAFDNRMTGGMKMLGSVAIR